MNGTYDNLDTRITIVETQITAMQAVLNGQREAIDRLLNVAYQNSRDMAAVKSDIESHTDKVLGLISVHAQEEAKERHRHTSYALWTLVTLFATLGTAAATIVFV